MFNPNDQAENLIENLEQNLEIDKKINIEQKLKIAIVGAGISGSSCAYFLKQMFDNRADITVFEKTTHVGGRLRTLEFKNRKYELGGSILHPSNLYMKKFLKICGLEKREDGNSRNEYVALFDKNSSIIIEKTGNYFGIFDKLRFINHFGFMQLYKLEKFVNSFVSQFSKIYKLQDSGFTFTSLDEFLNKVSPKLYKASQKSLRLVLEEEKFSDKIINEMASIACLANYGQTVDTDGFVGLVSLAGVTGDLWAIKDGNYLVPQELLKKSGATLMLNTNIKLICKDKTNEDKNMIIYENENESQITDTFDYVIIGFPIYSGIIGENFQLDFDSSKMENLQMQLTNTYFIYGTVKLFDKLPNNKRIQLHSVDPSIPYRTICVNLPCDYSEKNDSKLYLEGGDKLYKIFSEVDLNKETFDEIFENGYKIVTSEPWRAYPKYNENPKFKVIPDVVLDNSDRSRVLYLNSLEWSSSCMEICSISARNVSLIIGNKESALKSKKKINYSNRKHEGTNEFLHKLCGLFSILSIAAFLLSLYLNR